VRTPRRRLSHRSAPRQAEEPRLVPNCPEGPLRGPSSSWRPTRAMRRRRPRAGGHRLGPAYGAVTPFMETDGRWHDPNRTRRRGVLMGGIIRTPDASRQPGRGARPNARGTVPAHRCPSPKARTRVRSSGQGESAGGTNGMKNLRPLKIRERQPYFSGESRQNSSCGRFHLQRTGEKHVWERAFHADRCRSLVGCSDARVAAL